MLHSPGLPFDLRLLEIFLAVCDAGGMAGAARRLGLSQPAVSQAIAEIEKRTGVALLDRGVRPLSPTPAGVLLRQRGAALLEEARQIAPLLRQVRQRRLALLRIGMVDSLSRAVLGPLAQQLETMADQVMFLSGLTASHASALLTRHLDICLGTDALQDLDGLERWNLFDEPYILALPSGVDLPGGLSAAASLTALSERLPLARYSARSRTGIDIERHLRRLQLDLPRHQEFDTPYGVMAMVEQGIAWGMTTPLCIYEARTDLNRIRCLPLPGPSLRRQLTLVARRRELGTVPRSLAQGVRKALEAEAMPWLRRSMGWVCEGKTELLPPLSSMTGPNADHGMGD
ncbi:Transcriptional regulator, LysR family [Granulibacter bethesdensis]|uniref:LysR family transcriptional regulator n=1 Tax=Granulibacter bethesdensis TaxID=364410 RepID=UPI00090CCDB8|nr:LysR family transcriptional regulator [Granulibacter bethesdensis]APH55959.1 Transcriptional regulator, LysR family [Granulibacter bethesdensis]